MINQKCNYCGSNTKKNGFQSNGKQRYKCLSTSCGKCMQKEYVYLAKTPEVWHLFMKFRKINISIRGLSEFLEINQKTVSKWVLKAKRLQPKYNFPIGCNYDMDELYTYYGSKENKCCVAYGWNRDLHLPVGLHVGGWIEEELNKVGVKIMFFHPRKVYTDGLRQYKKIFSSIKHEVGRHVANHIERQNLNLRKDISFLSRKTICFVRTIQMLEARIKWYFWGHQEPFFFLK